MNRTPSLSVELPEELADRLAQLAISTDRSVSDWIVQAVEDLVALQDWQVQAIQEGIAAAERGEVVSHEQVLAEVANWEAHAS